MSAMEPRSSLASAGSTRSSLARGVHFGEGVEWHNAAPAPAGAQIEKNMPEQLIQELDRISPGVPAMRKAQIEDVMAEVLTICRACVGQAMGGMVQQGNESNLLPLGSHHLGVTLQGDEVDVLFVAPLEPQLAELPGKVTAELERRGVAKNITPAGTDGLFAAPGLRFEMRGVCMKVLFAQRIPGLPQPRQEAIVQNMAGLYSREATEKILSSVPNVDIFRSLLRFVRYWAKTRGVYGGFLGFPGGMAWAICCARICRMYPSIELPQLAARFFRTLSRWDWRQPLALDNSPAPGPTNIGSPQVPGVTGPCSMVVLLPVGSGITATSQVSETTMKITQKEVRRGYKLVQQVELARALWVDVYKEARFFQRHRHYLEFDFMARTEAIQASWIQWGRLQIQDLVRLFESLSSNIVTVRPWPEWVEFKDADWPYARAIFVGLHLERDIEGQQEGQRRSFDLREPIVKFLEAISAWSEAEKHANHFELLIKHVRAADLDQWLENRQKGIVASQGSGATAIQGIGGSAPGVQRVGRTAIEDYEGGPPGMQQCAV